MVKPIENEAIDAEVVDKEKPSNLVVTKKLSKVNEASQVSVVAGLAITTKELDAALKAQTAQRKLIANFIKKHLVKGVDFLQIHVARNCQVEEARRGSCRNKHHLSKPILAKPGQEKIFSLFQLTSELVRDDETMAMLEGTRNLVAYKCIVKNQDKVVAEGRGAAVVGDNRRDVNATIKIAEKRARMDACLALGFSEYFAQDLDDPDYQNQRQMANDEAANRAEATINDEDPINNQERQILAKLLIKRGFKGDEQLEYLKQNGIEDPKKLNHGQYKQLVEKLQSSPVDPPSDPNSPEAVDAAFNDMQKRKTEQLESEPELEVDEQMKEAVSQMAKDLCLNKRGEMWLMRKIAGKPFGTFETLTDDEWRRAYDIITAISDGNIKLDDGHIKDNEINKEVPNE